MTDREAVKLLTGMSDAELTELGGFASDPVVYEPSGLDEFHPDTTHNPVVDDGAWALFPAVQP